MVVQALSDARRRALRAEYTARINRVMDHIEAHLAEELTLDELAGVACFSAFHFHRVFRAMTGEPLGRFIQRLRLERAASQLLGSPDKPITEVALDSGFSGSDTFARAFRGAFGVSASAWRAGERSDESKIGQTNRNPGMSLGNQGQELRVSVRYGVGNTTTWRVDMTEQQTTTLTAHVQVKPLSEQTVAYVRHIGPYAGDSELFSQLFHKLFGWAGPRGLIGRPDQQVLSVYHDDPEITAEENLRVSACLTVEPDTEVSGEIGKMTLPGGDYAIAHFELLPTQFGEAWTAVMKGWLPESGYQPDDRPCFERCLSGPEDDPEGRMKVDICVPVRPL